MISSEKLKQLLQVLLLFVAVTGLVYVLSTSPYTAPLRFPIIFGVILLGFPFVANSFLSTLFQNLFAINTALEIGSVVFATSMAALMITYQTQQRLSHMSEAKKIIILPDSLLLKISFVLIIPTLIFVILRSYPEIRGNSTKKIQTIFFGILGGLLIDLIAVKIIFYASSLIPASDQYSSFGISLVVCGVAVYIATSWLTKPRLEKPGIIKKLPKQIQELLSNTPVLLHFYYLVWIWSGLLGFLAFFLDQHHIPVTLSLIFISGLMYLAFDVDHFYKLDELKGDELKGDELKGDELKGDKSKGDELKGDKSKKSHNALDQMRNFEDAIKNRLAKTTRKDTLVVVAASGGGIQAAGWTAQVLRGLQQELKEEFTKSIGLISSVSGGSVGAMNFIDQFDLNNGYPGNIDQAFANSIRDNLDAVGWGLAGPDFLRFIGIPIDILFSKKLRYVDRGYAIEDDWKTKMQTSDQTLSGWRQQILSGQIPIPVFNATLVEDGRRYLISPMTFFKSKSDADKSKAFDFNTLFNSDDTKPKSVIYDLNVTTAARLSASFPYVSPISRNDGSFTYNYHVTDGGYFDNSGMFTAVEWLDGNLEMLVKNAGVKKVILIQINASPDQELQEQVGDKGFIMEWVGPANAVYTVRDSTLLSRNAKEIELLKQRFKTDDTDTKSQSDATESTPKTVDECKIEYFAFSFPNKKDFEKFQTDHKSQKRISGDQPLSWRLTSEQKEALERGWEIVASGDEKSEFSRLRQFWQS